jgi:Skp family chaperone for outer membrane proteins
MKKWISLALLSSCLLLSGCQSAYYGAMEKVGYHKRDIMVDRVQEAKESQQEAQQQFSSALAEMQALLAFDGGDLEDAYHKAKDEYESAQSAADDFSKRIKKSKMSLKHYLTNGKLKPRRSAKPVYAVIATRNSTRPSGHIARSSKVCVE